MALGHHHPQLKTALNVAQHKTVKSLKTLKNTVVVVVVELKCMALKHKPWR